MRILLTGHLGYLGSEFLSRNNGDYEIVGYDNKEGDELLDYKNLRKKMDGVEQVVHLAAIPKPDEGKSFEDYFRNNVEGTLNVARASKEVGVKRIVYGSSTTIYGIEKGIPFKTPITESQAFVSQYIQADQLSSRNVDLSYHISKVMAEQIMAWYGLNKELQTTTLRFGPINKVFLGTSVSINNATQAIKLALDYKGELWYEPFSIVDKIDHIDISRAREILGYQPEKPRYTLEQIHSSLKERTN